MLLLKFWNKHSFYVVMALFLAAAGAYFLRPIGDDEAWVGEYAYWLHKDGHVHSMLMQDYYLHEKHVLTHHYLFLRVTTPLLYFLPWSIFTLRIIPVVFGLLTLVLMMQFAARDLMYNRQQVWLAAAVFLAIPVVQEFFTYYRPEFMLSAFGFGSFWILSRKRDKALYMIPAGLLAGFAMLSHLNGMVLVFTGCLMLLWYRQWLGFFGFGFAAFVGFLPYLLLIIPEIDTFFLQLSSGANASSDKLKWLGPLLNLLNEQKRFFHGPFTIFSTALLVFSLWLLIRKEELSGKMRFLIRYTLVLMLLVGIIAPSKTVKYGIIYLPQVALIISAAMPVFLARAAQLSKGLRLVYFAAWAGFTVMAAVAIGRPYVMEETYTAEINRKIAGNIPEGSTVLAPVQFVFDDIEAYNTYGLINLLALEKPELKTQALIDFCKRKRIEYVVLNDAWKGRISDFQQQQKLFGAHFGEVEKVNNFSVYKIITTN